MGLDYEIPSLDYEQIRQRAESFLQRYHPSDEIPVPIEEIVEFQLGLNIIPVPGLRQVLDVEGFTLAHEVAHLELHPQLFDSRKARNILEWKDFVRSIPEDVYSRAEYQAYCFAGLVLVPRTPLLGVVKAEVGLLKGRSWIRSLNPDFLWSVIEGAVAKRFVVSRPVIHRRIEYDNVRTKLDLHSDPTAG